MKLQLIVVETGELWRRALLRMVLDPKGVSHNDYGSFQAPEGHHIVNIPGSARKDPIHDGISTKLSSEMAQDIYQRQPLLPHSAKDNLWADNQNPNSAAEYYDDVEEARIVDDRGKNGMVKIEVPPPLREEPRFPKEKWKTFVAFLILLVNFTLTTASLALTHERLPDRKPLPDILLDNVEYAEWALSVSEYLIMVSTISTFVFLMFHKHRYIVARRVFLILSLLYLLRSITMFVTVLPVADPNYYCSPKANSTTGLMVAKRVWQLMSGFGLSINGKHTYCGDYIYSGHTVILVMAYLIIAEYSPKRCFPFHWISWMVSFTGIVMVLIGRGHYTVDVLIAYYVTTTLFWIYHTLANNPQLKKNGPNNFLARIWWYPIFRYMEKNVEGPVPRQYEWPLPWPRWCHSKHPNRNS